MNWFRLYHEFATDPKVQMMSEAHQRRLVMVFCMRCNGDVVDDDQVAFVMRINKEELTQTKMEFINKGFIDEEWNVLNWDKRQYISDTSNKRVTKYREKRKSMGLSANGYLKHSVTVTQRDDGQCIYCGSSENICIDHILPVNLGGNDDIENLGVACKECNSGKSGRTPDIAGYSFLNKTREKEWKNWLSQRVTVTVTPPDTEQNRTEQNKKTKEKKVSLDELSVDHIAEWLMEKRVQGKYLTIDEHGQLEYFKGYCEAKGRHYADYVAAFRNSFNWDNAIKKGGKNEFRSSNVQSISERARAAANQANRELGLPEI